MTMSVKQVRTAAGDTVDRLLWQHLGRNDEAVTGAFWRLNPHAAEFGPIFPIGVVLALPQMSAPAAKARVSAWS